MSKFEKLKSKIEEVSKVNGKWDADFQFNGFDYLVGMHEEGIVFKVEYEDVVFSEENLTEDEIDYIMDMIDIAMKVSGVSGDEEDEEDMEFYCEIKNGNFNGWLQ